jgi:hypothetical protein
MEGHCSTELTVDRYGHPIAGANVSFVDWLEKVAVQEMRMDQGDVPPCAQPVLSGVSHP